VPGDIAEPKPDPRSTAPTEAEAVYEGALERIRRIMLVLMVPLSGGAWWRFGWRSALGFALGCVVSYLNFHWLKRGVQGLADRIVHAGRPQSSRGIVARFLLRYVLMGLASYGILTVSPASLYGLFVGLFLPVGGIACEAAYEAYVALARGL
jgi:hypothetical protein